MTGRQEKEDDGTSKEQLQFELRTYHDALNSIRELQELSLHHNNSEFLYTICRARILIENQSHMCRKTYYTFGNNKQCM
jgi:uncharacterized membrane protein